MVEITRSAGSYALIAPASQSASAETLSKLSQATGRSVSTTETSLAVQINDLTRFVGNVGSEADPVANLETLRGLTRSSDVSASLSAALAIVRQRFASVEGRNRTRTFAGAGNTAGNALLNLLGSANDRFSSFNFDALFRRSSTTGATRKIDVSASRAAGGDPFARTAPVTTAIGGAATVSLERAALRVEAFNVQIDKSRPDLGSLSLSGYVADGNASDDNDGFSIRSSTGSGDDTVIFDTRDRTNQDGRLSAITLDTGDGSDVVFIAGNNASRIDAGAGDDFVAVEGDSVVNGGAGNDLIFARNASGDEGDDVLFSNSFASGGTGNDTITIFSLGAEDNGPKVAFGGEGEDHVVASVKADIDGGDGNDVLVLRDGGSASGGAGDDKISAFADSTLDGGAGNDDIYLLKGGSADGGEGDDVIQAQRYATVSGGTGNDTVTLIGGGAYTYRKGDGNDTLELGQVQVDPEAKNPDVQNGLPVNRIVLDNFDYSDLTLSVDALSIKVQSGDADSGDDLLKVSREVLGKVNVVFRKDGYEQALQVDGLSQTLGARVKISA